MSGKVSDNLGRSSGLIKAASAAAGGISWQSVETGATFTAVAGNGYPVNTTAQACTVTLPAGSVGDTIEFVDYAGTWDTNNVTLTADGSEKIKGSTVDALLTGEREAVTITYVDATQGWVTTSAANDNNAAIQFPEYIAATEPDGASGTTDGDYKVHIFTATKTGSNGFSVSAAGNSAGSNGVEYLVIAGGAGGGCCRGCGGGAGGMKTATAFTVTAQDYDVTVGAGGAGGSTSQGGDGSDSVFSTITSTGGGGGGYDGGESGRNGGSGGGATGSGSAGEGISGQGNDGGTGTMGAPAYPGGGGGGKGAVGESVSSGTTGGAGGAGEANDIVESGTDVTYAGGGGGSVHTTGTGGAGGAGGGGAGGTQAVGTAGTANLGGGGGAGSASGAVGGAGGSGYVVIRYKFQ